MTTTTDAPKELYERAKFDDVIETRLLLQQQQQQQQDDTPDTFVAPAAAANALLSFPLVLPTPSLQPPQCPVASASRSRGERTGPLLSERSPLLSEASHPSAPA
jgi:hypothetical protein